MKMNVFQYAAACEMWWKELVSESFNPYTPITTFFEDLSIAEFYGEESIRDTYRDVMASWGEDIKFITEFSMCLNHKIWQLYQHNEHIARVYDELWRKSVDYIVNHFEGEDLSYYYSGVFHMQMCFWKVFAERYRLSFLHNFPTRFGIDR